MVMFRPSRWSCTGDKTAITRRTPPPSSETAPATAVRSTTSRVTRSGRATAYTPAASSRILSFAVLRAVSSSRNVETRRQEGRSGGEGAAGGCDGGVGNAGCDGGGGFLGEGGGGAATQVIETIARAASPVHPPPRTYLRAKSSTATWGGVGTAVDRAEAYSKRNEEEYTLALALSHALPCSPLNCHTTSPAVSQRCVAVKHLQGAVGHDEFDAVAPPAPTSRSVPMVAPCIW